MKINEDRVAFWNPPGLATFRPQTYSHVALVSPGPLLFISGQVAPDKGGLVIGADDVVTQTIQVFENIMRALEPYGGSLTDIIKLTIYLTDIGDAARIRDLRLKYFPNTQPTSTLVEVAKLVLPDLKIEIEAIAAVSSGMRS